MNRPRNSPGPRAPVERTEFVIDQTSQWIRSADTKASILASFVGAQVAFVVANASTVERGLAGTFGGIVLALGATYLVSLGATAFCLGSVIRPRTPVTGSGNPYSWLDIASGSARNDSIEEEDLARAAMQQARILANVADAKYRRFGQAILLFSIMASSGFGLVVLASL